MEKLQPVIYEKTIWKNDTAPDIDEITLNNIEQGIFQVTALLNNLVEEYEALTGNVLLKNMIVNNFLTNVPGTVADGRALKTLKDLLDQQNSEIGAIVANPKTKLLIKYGNTSISSNPDGTFRLTHGLGVPCVVIARFGGANARYITFGGDIDPNNAYGIVRETTGEGYAFSGYIFWVAIGFVAK